MNYLMISPPIYVYHGEGEDRVLITAYGWYETAPGMPLVPVVGNPDGPGIGPWHLYYGEDPWTVT